MQSSDTVKKSNKSAFTSSSSATESSTKQAGGSGSSSSSSSSSSNINSPKSSNTSNQETIETPTKLKEQREGISKQSPESRKRSGTSEGGRQQSSKSLKKTHDASPSSTSSRSSPTTQQQQQRNISPRPSHKQSPQKVSSLDAAGTASQGSPNSRAKAGQQYTLRSPQRSLGSKAAAARKDDDADDDEDEDISDEHVDSLRSDLINESVGEVDSSLSASNSAGSFGETEGEPSSITTTSRRRYADHQNEEIINSEDSLPHDSHPQSLSATVSRGTFHQCGTARRVKVYELKGETWHDRGTGYCAGVYDEQHDAALLVARIEEGCRKLTVLPDGVGDNIETVEEPAIASIEIAAAAAASSSDEQVGVEGKEDREHFMLVVSENLGEEELLLKTRVVKEDVYQRQQDTLVVWTEPDGTDMALSFQEADGCHEVWEFLTEVQKHFILNASQGREAVIEEIEPEDPASGALGVSNTGTISDGELVMSDGSSFNLPAPTMDSLEVIDLTLKDAASRSPQAREKVAEWILREDYLLRLLPVFQDAEDLEQLTELHRLCSIMHTILMLNDSVLVERVLQEDVFLGAVGMLEYDPVFPRLKASYRDYLLNTTKFRQVVTIHDASILSKIHQTFRLQYLKDVVLARILDDSTFAVLNSLIFYHQADIIAFCTSSENFLASLFQIFDKNKVESEEKKAEAIIFLQQLCAMGKQVQLPYRVALYRTLTEWGLLIVLEYALTRKEPRLRNAAAEVLMTITEYDAMGVRVHVLEQIDKVATPLMTKLSDILHEGDGELGLKTQITESLRILFDSGPDGSSGGPNVAQTLAAAAAAAAAAANDGGRNQKDDTDKFLNWFYDGEVDHLFSPLKNLTTYKELSQQLVNSKRATVIDITSPAKSALFNHLCELLTFIMIHHHFRSQYWVISSDISMRVATLLFAREKHLRLSALRFFRACLAKGNQFVNRHFLKIELLGAILAVVEGESNRDNLVMSACLEFFEHIRKENVRPLLAHLMERHEARVVALIDNPKIGHYFRALTMQWEKNNERPPSIFLEGESSIISVHQAEKERRMRDIARRGDNRAVMDLDEESYFNDEVDEESSKQENLSISPLSAGKVTYDRSDGNIGESKSEGADEKVRWQQQGQGQGQGQGGEEEYSPILSMEGVSSLDLPLKRKKRGLGDDDAKDDDDDDMMGRLAKRKSNSIVASDTDNTQGDDDNAGGFIKEEEDDKDQDDNEALLSQGEKIKTNSTHSKRLTIHLTPGSEKMVKEDT